MKWSIPGTIFAGVAVLACVSLSSVAGNKRVAKPIVQVYYESLCGDSRRFIQRQLYPAKTSPLGEHFYVQLIPYGKATTKQSGDTYTFTCQHGPDECRGNKLQACAIRHLSEEQSFEFVHCAMSAKYPPDSLDECTQKVGVPKDAIEACTNGQEGDELLAANGNRTHSLNPKLYFVPWITINGIFDQVKFQSALANLKGVLCKELHEDGKTPEPCKGVDLTFDSKAKQINGSGSWLQSSNKSILQLITTFSFLLISVL